MNTTQVELSPNQGVMSTMGVNGDTKLIWDRTKHVEVTIAREAFNKAKASGYMGYKVTGEDGKKGEVIHEFDPKAERIILAAPMQGG